MNSQQALSVSKSNNIQRIKSTVNRHVDRHAILATGCVIIRNFNGLAFFIWISLSTQLKEICMQKLGASVTVLKYREGSKIISTILCKVLLSIFMGRNANQQALGQNLKFWAILALFWCILVRVCSQRWVRLELENFPFSIFLPVEISILAHPKQISVISNSDKKGGKKVLRSFSYLSPIIFGFLLSLSQFLFFSSPFSLFSLPLVSLSSSFPIPSLFLPFPRPFLPKFLHKLSKGGRLDCPPLFTPLILLHQK